MFILTACVYPVSYTHLDVYKRQPYAGLSAAYDWFYDTWLPQSGRELGNAPAFEEYLNNPENTAPADLMTDIHMPLK